MFQCFVVLEIRKEKNFYSYGWEKKEKKADGLNSYDIKKQIPNALHEN